MKAFFFACWILRTQHKTSQKMVLEKPFLQKQTAQAFFPQVKSQRQQGKVNLSALGTFSSSCSLEFIIYVDFCGYLTNGCLNLTISSLRAQASFVFFDSCIPGKIWSLALSRASNICRGRKGRRNRRGRWRKEWWGPQGTKCCFMARVLLEFAWLLSHERPRPTNTQTSDMCIYSQARREGPASENAKIGLKILFQPCNWTHQGRNWFSMPGNWWEFYYFWICKNSIELKSPTVPTSQLLVPDLGHIGDFCPRQQHALAAKSQKPYRLWAHLQAAQLPASSWCLCRWTCLKAVDSRGTGRPICAPFEPHLP